MKTPVLMEGYLQQRSFPLLGLLILTNFEPKASFPYWSTSNPIPSIHDISSTNANIQST